MEFKTLNQENQLEAIDAASSEKLQVIFKHSTRCSVSTFAQRVLRSEFNDKLDNELDVHYLDLIAYRSISNAIADRYGIIHESPQLLAIKDGVCVYNASHSDVSLEKLKSAIS